MLVLFFATSCNEEERFPQHNTLVVEGWIDDGGFPIVMVTQALQLSSDYTNLFALEDHIVKWAKVTISDEEDSVVLIGKYDKGYFPPYIYTTSAMRGEAGKRYHLTIEYKDQRLTAETTIPQSPRIDSLSVERGEGSDTLFNVKAHFTDDKLTRKFYQMFTRVEDDRKQYIASYLGNFDSNILSHHNSVNAYRGWKIKQEYYTPYFKIDDIVCVKLATLDSISYNFWADYNKTLSFSGNMFMPMSTNIRSNINGGLGYWCGFGTDIKKIVVKYAVEGSKSIKNN